MKKNILSFFLVFFTLLFVGPILSSLLLSEDTIFSNPWLSYSALFIPYILSFLLIFLLKGFSCFRGRDGRKGDKGLFLLSLSITLLLLLLLSLMSHPHPYERSIKDKLISALLSLIFIPMQITVEEYLFRALPLRMIAGSKWPEGRKDALIISLFSALLFTLPHLGNREVWVEGGIWAVVYYFIWGFLASCSAAKSGGFEIPLAMHLANNLFVAICVSYRGASLTSVPFFITENETSSPLSVLSMMGIFLAVYLCTSIYKKEKQEIRNCHDKEKKV